MHPDSKLASHGKTGNGAAQSQPHNVSPTPTSHLGSKGVGGGGNHGSQPPAGHVGLKSSPAPGSVFGALKGRAKRERSISADSAEQREANAIPLEKELAGEVAPRSKRRCVLERKQPYSGDEWCSGPDSEEEEKSLGSGGGTHNCHGAEPGMSSAAPLGPGANPLPSLSEASASSAAPGLRADAGGKQALQVVFVFTTHLANTAAEAVLQGRADSILDYHQQHVPRAKLDQPASLPKMPGTAKPPSPAGTPQGQPAVPPSSQAQGQPPGPPALGLSQGPPLEGAPEDPCRDLTPNSVGNGSNSGSSTAPSGTHPNTPTAPSALPAGPAEALLGDGANGRPPSAGSRTHGGLHTEGLSKEQLEHRERSLQTLRDIERLLLRSSEAAEPFLKGGEGGGLPPPAPGPLPPGAAGKKYEEPLQSMISQTQSLGGPGLEPAGPMPPGGDLGPPVNVMLQRLGQDGLTPEQVAWRKLQEEYYEEKRRKEEQAGLHGGRPLPEVMLAQPVGGVMLRGPPPPYHSKPGEQWLLRGVPLDVQEQLRPPFPGPARFPGSPLPRGFVEPMGPLGSLPPRPPRPGLSWGEEMPGPFAPGGLPYPPGQGEAERFLPPRAREELLRRQLRPLGPEAERGMPAHRPGERALFAGEGLGLEFGSRALLSPPPSLQDLEPSALGPPANLNMNMNVNMNMNLNVQMSPQQQQQQQQLLMAQKVRGTELLPSEDLARARAPNGTMGAMMGAPQKMMVGPPFPGQGQPPPQPQPQPHGFPPGQGPYPPGPQDMGSTPDLFGPEQGSLATTARLSHVSLPSGTGASATNMHPAPGRALGRRPSDLALNMGPMNSPSVGRLKSPTLSQVHSPLGTSPSANLKSPQTPSAMINLPASSAPLKSPQVLGSVLSVRSPTGSPGHLKSPSMAVSSPGWAASPKNALSSPGKPTLGMSSSTPMGSVEQGLMPPGSLSSSSAPPGNASGPLNPTLPFPSSPDPPPSQNPLSLMMSQMSKYAMPSSTPLYHNAIKTLAASDDELLPDRPLLPPGATAGLGGNQPAPMHMNSMGQVPAPSPLGLNLPGQQPLSHEPAAPPTASPSPLGASLPLHGGAPAQNPLMLPPGPHEPLGQPCGPPGPLAFPPRLQPPSANGGGLPMAPGAGLPQGPPPQQHYPPGLGLPAEEPPPPQRLAGPYGPVLPGVASVLSDPELSDVIRPTPTGIPEFDLSRIIPSEKPSSTLQYFPKGEAHGVKALPAANLHLVNLQNMMAEQGPARAGPQVLQRGMAMCHPTQVPMLSRAGLAPQQAVVGNSLHQGLMLPQQNLLAQQNFLLMQAKQRTMSVSGEMYGQPGHLLSPQGSLMGPPSQQNLLASHPLRQRSVSLDGQMSYGPGAGSMPF